MIPINIKNFQESTIAERSIAVIRENDKFDLSNPRMVSRRIYMQMIHNERTVNSYRMIY